MKRIAERTALNSVINNIVTQTAADTEMQGLQRARALSLRPGNLGQVIVLCKLGFDTYTPMPAKFSRGEIVARFWMGIGLPSFGGSDRRAATASR